MIHLMSSHLSGCPLVAICTECEDRSEGIWVRPQDDPYAETLAAWMRDHRRKTTPHLVLQGESNG